MSKISLGIVGAGTAFWELHFPVLKNRNDIRISHIFSRDKDRAEAMANKLVALGLERPNTCTNDAEIPNIDAALIAVPISETFKMVKRFLQSGCHVLAEKPLSDNIEQANELNSIAKQRNVALLPGENFRLQQDFSRIHQLVESGIIGEERLYFLNDLHFTAIDSLYARTSWRQEGVHSGGYIIDGGTHIIAGLREMVKRPIKSVHAIATRTQSYLSNQIDSMLINIKFDGGLIGHLALGYGVYDHESRHPKIYGTQGTICLDKNDIILINSKGTSTLEKRTNNNGFYEEWDIFCDAIISRNYSAVREYTYESIEDLKVLDAAIRSAKTGNIVRLD